MQIKPTSFLSLKLKTELGELPNQIDFGNKSEKDVNNIIDNIMADDDEEAPKLKQSFVMKEPKTVVSEKPTETPASDMMEDDINDL